MTSSHDGERLLQRLVSQRDDLIDEMISTSDRSVAVKGREEDLRVELEQQMVDLARVQACISAVRDRLDGQ